MKTKLLLFITICFINGIVYAQNPEWIVYDTSNSGLPANVIKDILIDENQTIWIAIGKNGLVKYDGTNWLVYDSMLCTPHISSLALDGMNNIWLGLLYGGDGALVGCIAEFDGINWTTYSTIEDIWNLAIDNTNNIWVGIRDNAIGKFDKISWVYYNPSNSNFPSIQVNEIVIDINNNVLVGTSEGLAIFDNSNWIVYDTSNSGLPNNNVWGIAVDSGTIWVGTSNGLAKFANNSWTIYDTSNSGLPNNNIGEFAIENGDIWIAVHGGLAKFDGINWTIYDTSNSDLPNPNVTSIAIDKNGNKWIGTAKGGLAVYKKGGVVSINEDILSENNKGIILYNYPNPFKKTTIFHFFIPENNHVILRLYDFHGKEIAVLLNENKLQGYHQVRYNNNDLSNGIYFYQLQTTSNILTKKMIIIK